MRHKHNYKKRKWERKKSVFFVSNFVAASFFFRKKIRFFEVLQERATVKKGDKATFP